ncbi:MAG: HlyD family type I secretion periplasmic adaptor subunit [Rhodospirillaceae bacterium]|nr:HlyD family type I secretion periplasmic adaptor subunit [Rhodospirillaceae bacterium]
MAERAPAADKFSYTDPRLLHSSAETVATEGARRFGAYLAMVLGAFFLVFLVWARLSYMDEITRGPSRVIASGQNKVVQAPDAGVVKAIFVKEGDFVAANQPLMRIDATPSKAALEEKLSQLYALMARAARLTAEAESRPGIAFPREVQENAPREVLAETALFRSRAQQMRGELATLEQQVAQRQQQLREGQSTVARLEARLKLQRAEEYDTCKAWRDGSASRSECQQAQRASLETAGQVESERRGVPRAEAALREAQQKMEDKRAQFRSDARKDLNDVEAQIAALRPQVKKEGQTVLLTELRSPVRGIVKTVGVTTIGGVVKPGEPLIEIVPAEDTLLVEVRIKPSDIAFLRMEQDATIKISAYDYSIFGGLEGKVVEISSDVIVDEKKTSHGERDTYYRVRVKAQKAYLERDKQILPIIPGMTGTVDIRTGRRTVLDRFLDPFYRLFSDSLGER